MSSVYQHIFVRHVSTDKNRADYDDSLELQEKITSITESSIPVNEEGFSEGRLLKEYFGDYLLSKGITGTISIFHSGYKRTEATLSYILESIYAKGPAFSISGPITDESIRDHNQGLANNIPFEEVKKRFPKYAEDIEANGYLDAVPPEGESFREATERIKTFIKKIESLGHHSITITHFSTLLMIRQILENLPDEEVIDILANKHFPNGSITRYIYHPDANIWRLEDLLLKPENIKTAE